MKILKFFLIALIFFITSCSPVPYWWKPRGYLLFSMMPKGGSPGYNLGWVHGCHSGAGSQFGGGFFKTFYTWKRDPDLTITKPDINKIRKKYGKKELKDVNWDDPADVKKNLSDYNLVFWDAHFVCRQVVLGTLQMADMTPTLPGQVRYDPAAHSVGNVWKTNAKGDVRLGSPAGTGGYW